ncbi:ATP-binding protein [candidate division KSB1 bacterium]
MRPETSILNRFFPRYLKNRKGTDDSSARYKLLWVYSVLLTSLVSLAPLIAMTAINISQYHKMFENEITYSINNVVSNAKRSIELNLKERKSALAFVIDSESLEDLVDHEKLSDTFYHLRNSFSGFVDIGLIDSEGHQISYVGPYNLEGKNYSGQDWYHAVQLRDFYISDVFMGYRGFPHFVVAVKYQLNGGDFYILRATIDAEFINSQISALEFRPMSDLFIMNRQGILQTPSRGHGNILEKASLDVPPYTSAIQITEEIDNNENPYILGYAFIDESPFVFMVVNRPEELMQNWLTLRSDLIWFLIISIMLIIFVIFRGATYMVDSVRHADAKRAKILHDLEYTNKMASIGRLAAGVAHEINNPLAIINQKTGLLKDIVTFKEDMKEREKILDIVSSVLKSVDRCSTITQRFLGFAKRMDLKTETINLEHLVREVLGFLGKETEYRNISINFLVSENVPEIESDRGQLQQVFLNIINNALAAIDDHGRINIIINIRPGDMAAVTISDTGRGISKEDLKQIFEPFFTTKKEGTGLGLSITYGIVQKLGGTISVESTVGKGTSFTVLLPITKNGF